MKYTKHILTLMIAASGMSCSRTESKEKAVEADTIIKAVRTTHEAPAGASENVPSTTESNPTTIKFAEFTLSISKMEVYDEEKALERIQGDSTYVRCEIGESILGQSIRITSSRFEDFKIEQQYETTVSIAAEGPHCDLLDWKHYNSGWKALEKKSDLHFVAGDYSEEEHQRFPSVDIDEFKQYVKKNCGPDWFETVKDNKSVNEGASAVGISKVVLKISAKEKSTGKPLVKIIAFEHALGC